MSCFCSSSVVWYWCFLCRVVICCVVRWVCFVFVGFCLVGGWWLLCGGFMLVCFRLCYCWLFRLCCLVGWCFLGCLLSAFSGFILVVGNGLG